MAELILKVDNLNVTIERKKILENISLKLHENEIVTIIGANGSGKSTLIKTILGLIEQFSGSIYINPHIKLGYMPQHLTLNENLPLTVMDFLSLGNYLVNISENLFNEVLEQTKIKPILNTQLRKVSGGEMQFVLLAKALLKAPKLLILDEPTQGIDINRQTEFYSLIEKLRLEKKMAFLIISHDLHMVMKTTDYVICLNHHICCEGTVSSLTNNPELAKIFSNEAFANFSFYEHHHDHSH